MIGKLLTRARPPTVQPVDTSWTGQWPWSETVVDVLPTATEAQALDLAPVSGVLGIVTSLVGQMPLKAYAGIVAIDPTPPILRNPAPGPNRVLSDLLGEYVRDVTLHGNFVAVLGDAGWDGWPAVIYPVPYGQWSTLPDGRYRIGADVYPARDVFHVRVRCRTGERVGRGLLETHPRLVAGAVAAETWAQRYFDGGTAPPVTVSHPNSELTQDQAADLKAKFAAATRLRQAVVVPSGTTVTALNAPADSAQLNESRRWGAQQLAMAMGCPAALLGLESPSLTYRNIQDVFSQFITTTVTGLIVPLEEQLTAQTLPRTLRARFDPSAVLRPDLASRVGIAVQGLTGGVYTPDEARALVDLPPGEAMPEEPAVPAEPALTVVPDEEAAS